MMFLLGWSSASITKHKVKRELIMHCEVTLVALKKLKQTNISEVRKKEMKKCKRNGTISKDPTRMRVGGIYSQELRLSMYFINS